MPYALLGASALQVLLLLFPSSCLFPAHHNRSSQEEGDSKIYPSAPAYDATLDFFSPQFDALKALFTPGLQPPNPKVGPSGNPAETHSLRSSCQGYTPLHGVLHIQSRIISLSVLHRHVYTCVKAVFVGAGVAA